MRHATRRLAVRRSLYLFAVFLAACLALTAPWLAFAQTKAAKTVRRAAAPKYTAADSKGVFFENVFDGRVLAGDRPADLSNAPAGGNRPMGAGGAPAAPSGGGNADSGWSKIVSSTTIEDEVKAIKLSVDKDVTTPTEFAGKGYKEVRRSFTILAMLFGIISEYDSDVRWKTDAPTARELFARTAANAKVGTQQVYNESKLRKGDLDELLSGSLSAKSNAEAKVVWNAVCDRSPLMQRLEIAHDTRLAQWTANKAEFNSKKEEILHEAQLVAAMGHVLMQEGMDDADADDYKSWCLSLKNAALDIADAVKLGNDDQARQAAGQISKACSDCHDKYR